MTPNGDDYLIGKYTRESDSSWILLLERDNKLIALKRPEGAVIHQESTPESVAFARDMLVLLGWKEHACLRNYQEGDL